MLENLNQGQVLTLSPMGVFVNDNPVTKYNGEEIEAVDKLPRCFTGSIMALEIMQSDTEGTYVGVTGNPTPIIDGRYVWIRGLSFDNVWSDWLFRANYKSLTDGGKLLSRWVIKDATIMTSKRRPEFYKTMMNTIAKRKEELLAR